VAAGAAEREGVQAARLSVPAAVRARARRPLARGALLPIIPRRRSRPGRLVRPRTPDFHSGNTGSNPVRDTTASRTAAAALRPEVPVTDACRDVEDLLQRVERAPGDRPLLAVGDQVLGGRALARRVRALAQALVAAGLRPGDRLAIHLHRCIDEVLVLLAAMR